MSADPHALATVVYARTEFEANLVVSVLAEAGIEAYAFGRAYSALPLNTRFTRVPVQVRAVDLEDAQEALDKNISDSIDLDWDEVDVGEREDSLPLRTPNRMPLAAKIATAAVFLLLLVTAVALLISLLV